MKNNRIMESNEKTKITVQTKVNAPLNQVWKCWTTPEDILCWNAASDDWHTTSADNFLEAGGKFNYRMEAKNGTFGFDFWGIYNKVIAQQLIEITLGDERRMRVAFSSVDGGTEVVETFEAEGENPVELQRAGWQAILDNFKKYVETKK
jgi:uncharacterized protein YndB with AHSA1/START domain